MSLPEPTQFPLTQHIDSSREAYNLAEYEAHGGYESVRKMLTELSPAAGLDLLKASDLRGRGGAGFPTGIKWSFVPMQSEAERLAKPMQKYIVANADEMEPGTFKDRVIMEGCPHLLVEGMIVGAAILQATTGYIFIRGEYIEAAEKLNKAISEC